MGDVKASEPLNQPGGHGAQTFLTGHNALRLLICVAEPRSGGNIVHSAEHGLGVQSINLDDLSTVWDYLNIVRDFF